MRVLQQKPERPMDLEKNQFCLLVIYLELVGKAKKGQGQKMALNLYNQVGLLKMQEIIQAQGGDSNIGF